MRHSSLPVVSTFIAIATFWSWGAQACDSCYGPSNLVMHERRVRRMQPSAQNATVANLPRGPLEWGQINFLHTTDTHGWLEGHIKEQNYGADWGDFVSFVKHMRRKAWNLDVDLLLIDTGDLHDGNGLSDAASPNGVYSNPIFENIDYDLLTIGNHELYVSAIAYETFSNFSRVYGDKYLTSNVQIANPTTGEFEYIGKQYRYFQTPKGLNIMAFGVLFDFTGNSNVSKVIKAATMVKQQWFIDAVNTTEPVDLFILTGHNPIKSGSGSSFRTVYQAIRALRPDTPIQGFGGHTHIRDFRVYDNSSTAIESGRYCETLGWVSMTGIESPSFHGAFKPQGVPNPTQPAVKVTATATSTATTTATATATVTSGNDASPVPYGNNGAPPPPWKNGPHGESVPVEHGANREGQPFGNHGVPPPPGPHAGPHGGNEGAVIANETHVPQYLYSRRYLDWNRLTFAYHASGSQDYTFGGHGGSKGNPSKKTFDTADGLEVTSQITDVRTKLNLTSLYGCAPQTWCLSCAPFGSSGNIYSLLETALATVVVNESRADIPRLIIINTGSIRFDLVEGPFTYDDSFIVSPFTDAFEFIPDVPYELASKVLGILNAGGYQKTKRSVDDFDHTGHNHAEDYAPFTGADSCLDPTLGHISSQQNLGSSTRGIVRRQTTSMVPGYTTTDDFGSTGDDTQHTDIPYYSQPNDLQANASFPTNGSLPSFVDLVFLDFIGEGYIIPALKKLGANYTAEDITYYLPETFTTNDYLPAYAKITESWQANVPNCPVGAGVGFAST